MTDVAAFPSYVVLDTVNFCNARCPFCPLYQGDSQMDRKLQPAAVMSKEMYEKLLEEMRRWERPPSDIEHNGQSEPFLDPKIFERLATIKRFSLGDKMRLLSNAQFLTNELALAIIDAGVGQVKIGFDGATKEVYEAHRVRCDYERVLANIRNFASARDKARSSTRIILKFVRTMMNEHEVVAAYELFGKFLNHALDRFEDTLAVDWGDRPADNAAIYSINKVSGRHGWDRCRLYESIAVVFPDGKVAACSWDYNLEVSDGGYGNVADDTLLSIWRGRKRRALGQSFITKEGIPGKCQSCTVMHEPRPVPARLMKLDEGRLDLRLPTGWLYKFS